MKKLLILTAFLMFFNAKNAFSESLLMEDAGNELKNHIELVIKNPKNFGFKDEAEARSASIGFIYPYFSINEWEAILKKGDAVKNKEIKYPPRRIIEVLGGDKPKSVIIQARLKNGAWAPSVLGFKNVADSLFFLKNNVRRENIVLLVNSETHKLYFVDQERPHVYSILGKNNE